MSKDSLYDHWLTERRERWKRLNTLARSDRADLDVASAREVLDGYGEVARDVSLARRHLPGTVLQRTAEALYGQLHSTIHGAPRHLLAGIATLYTQTLPQAVRRLGPDIVVAVGLFLATTLAGYLLVSAHPDTAEMFLSQQMMRMVQNGRLWTDDILNVTPSSVLSWELMTNNISVALTAFALGIIFGLGTLYILTVNGMMLGAVLAYTQGFDMHMRLLRFIVAHGIVELSIICLAAAAGLALGRALARPGEDGRVAALRRVAADAGALAAASVPFLVGAGLIEGYISPNDAFGFPTRITVGVAWFVVMVLALDGRVWPWAAQTLRSARRAR